MVLALRRLLMPKVSGRITHFGKPKDVGKSEYCTKRRFGKAAQQNLLLQESRVHYQWLA